MGGERGVGERRVGVKGEKKRCGVWVPNNTQRNATPHTTRYKTHEMFNNDIKYKDACSSLVMVMPTQFVGKIMAVFPTYPRGCVAPQFWFCRSPMAQMLIWLHPQGSPRVSFICSCYTILHWVPFGVGNICKGVLKSMVLL